MNQLDDDTCTSKERRPAQDVSQKAFRSLGECALLTPLSSIAKLPETLCWTQLSSDILRLVAKTELTFVADCYSRRE
jgi:hypothetical protein